MSDPEQGSVAVDFKVTRNDEAIRMNDEGRILVWELLHPEMTAGHLGNLPYFLSPDDPRSAREQFDEGYGFAGGWQPFKGHTLSADNSLSYPGDPPLFPLAQTRLRDELIVFYRHAWVAIIQPDRTYEVCRMD